MSPEQFTAVVGLGGVALGIFGTLAAARVQARGSHAQAEATRQAAETTAATQYASSLVQQNRASQRTAYLGLLTTAREFDRAAHVASAGGTRWGDGDSLAPQMLVVYAAFATVELEGPERVLPAARKIADATDGILDLFTSEERTLTSLARLYAALAGEFRPQAAYAEQLLRGLHRANMDLTSSQRLALVMAADTRHDVAHGLGRVGEAWLSAWRAAEMQLSLLADRGQLDEQQVGALLRDSGLIKPGTQESLNKLHDDLKDGIGLFVEVVRDYLNDTVPDLR
ncbi:hypothetical protein ABT237_20115 [Streptomyces sp. NPDC001581]|uniref:hypothetical protein n=1 Tax=Streptomyces sp. NPDC001581 TaxID=3154386 RepID=UPI00332E0154